MWKNSNEEEETLRFLCDGMLGKIARWLRLLGHDAKYSREIDDEDLIALSASEDRILLTRDVELYRKALKLGGKAFLIKGKTRAEKLAELAKKFKLKLDVDTSLSRCPKCNTQIKHIPKDEILDRIPEHTREIYDEFWICPRCGQIYWRGSHWRKITEILEESKRLIEIQYEEENLENFNKTGRQKNNFT
ncbi:TPA: hypothetical protein EYP70_04215 [Candidatus Bathyarchaeota archaeon]|nr:hypothetical protein [Candidatus Bathyarchaeota archaeon]